MPVAARASTRVVIHSLCQKLSFDGGTQACSWKVSFMFSRHFIENLVLSKPNPLISCIIADSFHVWASTIAKKYNLVNVSFWTEPATVLTVYYHMDLLKCNGHFGCHDKHENTIRYIPGVQAIESADLPSYCQDADPSTVMPVWCSSVLKMHRKRTSSSAIQ
ncbi:hypothetical protein P3L10_033148 [Capsicum annuum]